MLVRSEAFQARPSREFVPAAESLSCADKKVNKETAPAKPALRAALRCSDDEARAELAPLRSAQTTARSQLTKRAAHAPGRPALLGGLEGESRAQPNSPTAKPASRPSPAARYAPFSTAEQRKALRARAKRASRTDSVQLSEQSVAARVLRGPSKPEQLRAPATQRRAVRSGGALCLLSGGPESRSPAGAQSRHHSRRHTKGAKT
jgi:hypothetical protein